MRATGVSSGVTLNPGSTGVAATITVNSTGTYVVTYSISAAGPSSTTVLYSIGVNGSPPSLTGNAGNPTRLVQSIYDPDRYEGDSNSSVLPLNAADAISILAATTSASAIEINVAAATLHVERIE
jgi:hypothetical protein